ncbi:MAG: phage protein [Lachnospiraceae bacterium]|jgi:hypothetical protein|nr:phage protein [Lachnospiraceae bacterium]
MNRIYTEEHKQFIRDHVANRQFPELTEMLNIHFGTNFEESAIKSLVYRLGLSNGLSGVNLSKAGIEHRFQKGHIPANKGKKGTGGWEPTQFKKGSIPPNRRPIGSERIDSKDGYTYVKIQDGHLNKNWKQKHVLLWEEQNGPVPKGSVIIFGDGNKLNFNPDNLILVTRAQLARLNQLKLIQDSTELTRTGLVIADIANKIGQRRKKHSGQS